MDWVHKYHPTTFEQCAPTFARDALLRHLASDRSHAFLLDGVTGCGKTTVARLMAREIGCADPIERNMADDNKIEDVRLLLEDMTHPSLFTNQQVYILDEPQRVKRDVQQLLLKSLEDAPSFVTVVLCTTEPQALIEPIHARCHRVRVQPLNTIESKRLIGRIAKAEGIIFSDSADSYSSGVVRIFRLATGTAILDASRGRPRSLIRNLQLAVEGLPLLDTEATDPSPDVLALCRAIESGSWPSVVRELRTVSDYEGTRQALAHLFRSKLERGTMTSAQQLEALSGLILDPDGRNVLTLKCYKAWETGHEACREGAP